jgi:hypothetical protein
VYSDNQVPILNSIRVPDGKICLNEAGELAVTKFAVEPVRMKNPTLLQATLTLAGLVSSRCCRKVWYW